MTTLLMSAALVAASARADAKPEGVWEGALKVQAGIELRLVLHVARADDGTLKATLDSPDQGANGLKVDAVDLDDGTLKITMKRLRAEFSGQVNEKGTEAVGRWKQGPASLPLTLRKVDRPTELRRPQSPKKPYPYREEQVSYENEAGGVKIAGTLTLPKGDGPFPAALLITGSGSQDRDETLLGHKPFLVLADFLTRRGIAVLRVDDRGVGGSTGSPEKATSEDFAGDVRAGVSYLKGRKEIDPKAIGLIGHSEGGLIAPMVAAGSKDVAYIVLMAGPGLPGDEILAAQGGLVLKAMGADEAALKRQAEVSRTLFAIVKREADPAAASAQMQAAVKEMMAGLSAEQRKALSGGAEGAIEAQVKMLTSPWFRFFLTYDPRPTLAKVRCPVLAINGEKDLQVPPKENLKAIAETLQAAGNDRVTTRELPGLNHLFQTSQTGSPAEYARIEETFAPAALKVIGDWVTEQVGGK